MQTALTSNSLDANLVVSIPDVQLEHFIFQGSCLGYSSVDDSYSHNSLYHLHRRASPDKTAAVELWLGPMPGQCLCTVPD